MPSRLHRLTLLVVPFLLVSIALAQDIAPPVPQQFTLYSKILGEDRVILVRTPHNYDRNPVPLSVLYLTDGPDHINEIGATIDFLVRNDRMPPLIVVGIANTDRTRDLTPTHVDQKNPDGSLGAPTSGGGGRFIDFMQNELMPEIEKRYRTAPYRIFAGHSLGGLMAIHILSTRPDLFNAYIAVSPSLQWDDQRPLREALDFFAAHRELNKTFFFSLANEGNTPNPMGDAFNQLQKALSKKAPKGLHWDSARYPDETHGSTVLRAHYAGLRTIFSDWPMPTDPTNGIPIGGLAGVESHYHEISQRYGYPVNPPENLLNNLGYQLVATKKYDEAFATFQRNIALYPASANVYDSLGEGYESAGKFDLAKDQFQKAIETGARNSDPNLEIYKEHLQRVTAEIKSGADKTAPK